MASKALPIVSLDENSLRRLHQKLLKMKENETQETYKTPENQPRQRKAVRSPKFEVYRPGVTRLSNRTDNLNRETKKNSTPTKLEENSKEHKIGKGRKPLQKDKEKRYTREKQKEVKRSATQTRSTKSPRQDSDESSDMEEGYLTRQNKRLGKARKNSTTSSTDGTSEKPDELEWDNYNHSRLFDTWGDQHQQENNKHEYTNVDEYSEEEEKSPIISRNKERRAKSRKSSETSKAVVPKRKERMCYMDEHGSTNTDG
uniref:Uncharacterized protein n=1 Tax=Ciona savignyi TaxID=51511 RepID=H2Z5X1_CIOSA